MAIKISNNAAKSACDAVTALIDEGAGTTTLVIYGGSRPADCEEAIATQTALVTFDLPAPAFAAAADNLANAARATANAIAPATVAADGTATFFRVFNGDGIAVMDGTVTTQAGNGDLKLSDVNLVTGIQVQVFSFTITQSEG